MPSEVSRKPSTDCEYEFKRHSSSRSFLMFSVYIDPNQQTAYTDEITYAF
jgi:hypothetical protein